MLIESRCSAIGLVSAMSTKSVAAQHNPAPVDNIEGGGVGDSRRSSRDFFTQVKSLLACPNPVATQQLSRPRPSRIPLQHNSFHALQHNDFRA